MTKPKTHSLADIQQPDSLKNKNLSTQNITSTASSLLPEAFLLFLSSSTDVIYVKDAEFRYVCCSKPFATLAGLKRQQDVIGKTDFDLFDSEIAAKFRHDEELMFKTGVSTLNYFEQFPSPDHVPHYTDTSKYLIRDASGKILGLYGTSRDISEYSEDGAPVGIGVYCYHYDGRIERLYMNDSYYTLIDSDSDKRDVYTGFQAINAVHEDDITLLFAAIRSALVNEKIVNANIRIMTGRGTYKWFNVKARIAAKMEEKCICYVSFSDIDIEKTAVLQLQASQRIMELANKECQIAIWLYSLDQHKIVREFNEDLNSLTGTKMPLLDDWLNKELVFPEDEIHFMRMYQELHNGAERTECTIRIKGYTSQKYEWQHIVYSLLHDPYYHGHTAVGIAMNVDHQQEIILRYEHERQLRNDFIRRSIVSYELNLTSRTIDDYQTKFYDIDLVECPASITPHLENSILENVVPEYRELIRNTFFSEPLLEAFLRNESHVTLTYRRYNQQRDVIWVQTAATIMEKPGSDEIVAFIYIDDIDIEKKDQLAFESLTNMEIETACRINVKSEFAHFIKSSNGKEAPNSGQAFHFDTIMEIMLPTYVAPEDKKDCLAFFSLASLVSALSENSSVQFAFRRIEDGVVTRKRTLVYYLDETMEDIVLSTRDITGLYEEEQRQKTALKNAVTAANEANQAKSDFLSRMSHDMRTPMNAILGMVHLARQENNPEVTQDYLNKIDTSSHFLIGLINDILDLSCIENGKIELHPEVYRLDDFLKMIQTVIHPMMEERKITFTFRIENGLNQIVVDKLRFNQIFFNLLSNAAKYTEAGGQVSLLISALPDKGELHGMRYLVRDTGRGISKDFLDKIFDPFAQEKAANTEMQGSGLGLAIVKSLLDAMGGTISVNSVLGAGSEFTVDLYMPIDIEPSVTTPALSTDHSSLSGLRVLLVEDNAINILVAQKLLERKGCYVEVAENGLLGLSMFSSSLPGYYGIILMDIRMPVMDGIEATEHIRTLDRPDSKTIPIIAMTADAFVDDKDRTLHAGMNAHIVKPVDPQLMYNTIAFFVNKNR